MTTLVSNLYCSFNTRLDTKTELKIENKINTIMSIQKNLSKIHEFNHLLCITSSWKYMVSEVKERLNQYIEIILTDINERRDLEFMKKYYTLLLVQKKIQNISILYNKILFHDLLQYDNSSNDIELLLQNILSLI
jgi:hypothetical protein